MLLSERQALEEDASWLWSLYVDLLKEAVTKQWGWDESYQREMFKSRLPCSMFTCVLWEGEAVAAYAGVEKTDHYYLHMLLVVEKYQRQGVAKQVMGQLLSRAQNAKKSVRLSVIKANPVLDFYTKLGFKPISEDDNRYLLSREV